MKTQKITTDINLAINSLKIGKLVAIPTETVYGLAGNALNENALKQIFILKKRPLHNPLILHISSYEKLQEITKNIPFKAKKLAKKFWPGPLTLVLNKKNKISKTVSAGKSTIAVRVPNHPLTLKLLNSIDFPLAAPSANPSGFISPTSATHVSNFFKDGLDVILNGGSCSKGLESTIIGFENQDPILYRHGAIPISEIENCIGTIGRKIKNDLNPSSPGMLSRHYSPRTPIILVNSFSKYIYQNKHKKIGVLSFENKESYSLAIQQEILSKSGNINEAAKNFYSALHSLDSKNLDIIITTLLPEIGLGKTINDRLKRAVAN